MKTVRNQESGIIIVLAVFAIALLVFGYVAFRSITRSREAEVIKDSAGEVINQAEGLIQGN